MKPAFVNLNIYKGQTFRDVVVLEAPDGTPLPLLSTYDGARMQVRSYIDSPTVILDLSTTDGAIELTDDGQIKFNVSSTTTAGLTTVYDYEQWVYDLELYTGTGTTETVDKPLMGTVVVWPEVTRGM